MKFRNKRQRPKTFQKPMPFVRPQRNAEQVWVDYEKLPADLSPEDLAALDESLPKTTPQVEAQAGRSTPELQSMNLAELYEVAAAEKIDNVIGKKREDVIWEINAHRLQNACRWRCSACSTSTRTTTRSCARAPTPICPSPTTCSCRLRWSSATGCCRA
jgi:hypothetical protein